MKMRFDGSLTIELSLLMPFILAVFILILFSGFILHDKCIISKACLSSSLRGSEELKDDEAFEKANNALEDILPEKLLGKWNYSTQIDIEENKVMIGFEGDMLMTGGLVSLILNNNSASFNYSCISYRLNEAEYIKNAKKSGVGY